MQAVVRRPALLWGAVAVLLAVLALELAFAARQQSQTFDEGAHLYAGYTYWKDADFNVNAEHPPLVKLVAALPLLSMGLPVPPHTPGVPFRVENARNGNMLLYSNDADKVLFRARMAVAGLTVLLALVIFLAAREMFGAIPAFLALAIFVFEPNFLAHGALITTDAGLSLFLFLTVYCLYRFVKKPNLWRLGLAAVAAGLAIASKHSAVLLFPILALLIVVEMFGSWRESQREDADGKGAARLTPLRLAGATAVIVVGAVVVLWSVYAFRFHSQGLGGMSPALMDYARTLPGSFQSELIQTAAKWRLLPEPYLFGLTDVLMIRDRFGSFLLGELYPGPQWFYFPLTILIKSTLPFLALAVVAAVMIALGRMKKWREIVFLGVPPVAFLLIAMFTGPNMGVRHILPVYAFLIVLGAAAAWKLIESRRIWVYPVAALLVLHAATSLRAYPDYLAYSNEAWGGMNGSHKLLADSNVDWAQGLKSTKKYIDKHQVKDCWFAYFGRVVVDPAYYGIQCKPLPSMIPYLAHFPVDKFPAEIEGTVFVSATELSGQLYGPGKLNPFARFQKIEPDDTIGGSILVYRGRFDVSALAAVNDANMAFRSAEKNPEQAVALAKRAALMAPDSAYVHEVRGEVLAVARQYEESRQAFERALAVTREEDPFFQRQMIATIQKNLTEMDRLAGRRP